MNFLLFDDIFYYYWKPTGIPSTYGKEKCFLDLLLENNSNQIINQLFKIFGKEKELGLVNRLDNDTTGLLYFAKDNQIFETYKLKTSQQQIYKIYLADVHGDFPDKIKLITYPIMHHKHIITKMVAIKSAKYRSKGRDQLHLVETYIEKLYFDKILNISTLKIYIHKGIRHQIRVHMAAINYPIIGDKIYNKKYFKSNEILHLWSIGLKSVYNINK